MNAKKYLGQAYLINMDIASRLEQLEQLRSLAQRVTTVIGDVKVQTTRQKSPIENTIIKIMQAEDELNAVIDKLVETKENIRKMILKINNSDYRIVLELRYLCFNSWEKIAIKLNLSCNGVYQKHFRALQKFNKIYNAEVQKNV
ncbi:MAG: DUF1492 domain-containing protein [Firmicutes bacterium]|nr:DUF1492 domain-containing protein [Bacillota bacterium]